MPVTQDRMEESLTEKLATHLTRPVDEETRQRGRLHLLDWLGCVAGALSTDSGKRNAGDHEHATSWLGNVLEMDDIHRTSILHPGPVIWPAVEIKFPSMDKLLDAAIRGYEAIISIGTTFDSQHYSFFHNTATAGVFGSAVVCLPMVEPTKDDYANVLGLVGSVAGGLWQLRHEQSDAKQWHIAHAFRTGWAASLAVANGNSGPRFILEGPQGLYAATCRNPKPMSLANHWRIHEVSFKPWGACRHAHPAIDAALQLKEKLGKLDGDVRVETYADAITFCDCPTPKTVVDAKFSIQHCVAIVAERGAPQLADFEPDAIAALADTRSRINVSQTPDIVVRYPEHYGARVTCGGASVELVDTLGDPERPLSRDGIVAKAKMLIAWGGLPEVEADRAIDLALNGDDPAAVHKMLKGWLS